MVTSSIAIMQTAIVDCPKAKVGRVIGKAGSTIKALQNYTGAMIQIDQSHDPTRVTVCGTPQSLSLAVSMIQDIVDGHFKGFAMLRQVTGSKDSPPATPRATPAEQGIFGQQPVYVEGYGFVPPSQLFNSEVLLQSLATLQLQDKSTPGTPIGSGLAPGTPTGSRPSSVGRTREGSLCNSPLSSYLQTHPLVRVCELHRSFCV
jgi:hypothetical protein